MNNVIWQLSALKQDDQQFFSDWEILSNTFHGNNQLLSAEFAIALVKGFKPNDIYIATATLDGINQCMMLLRKRNALVWEIYKPSQAQLGLIVVNPKWKPDFSPLFKMLPGFCKRLDLLGLDPLEHQSILNLFITAKNQEYALNMQVHTKDDFETYWQQRPKNLRKNITRYENRISREDMVLTQNAITDTNGILAATDRYGLIESKGWKGKIGTAIHPSNQQGQFYRAFLSCLAQKNQAVVFESYFADTLVASRLCCIKKDMLIVLKTTFDEDFKAFAVGRLQLKFVIQHAFNSTAIDIIDFYTNASQEQLDWATHSRNIYNCSTYANSFIAKLFSVVARLKAIRQKNDVQQVSD